MATTIPPAVIGNPGDRNHYEQADTTVTRLRHITRSVMRLYEQELRALNVLVGIGHKGAKSNKQLTNVQIEKLRVGLVLLTDNEARKRRLELVEFLARCSKGALEAAKAHETIAGGMDDLQLQATMRAEFLRSAHTWTDEEWTVVDRVREARRQLGDAEPGRKAWKQLARIAAGAVSEESEA